MKRNPFCLFFLFVCVILTSCNNSSQKTTSTESKEEVIESVSDKDQNQVKAFLQELYDKYVFGNEEFCDFEEIVEHFSPKILTKLRNEFEFLMRKVPSAPVIAHSPFSFIRMEANSIGFCVSSSATRPAMVICWACAVSSWQNMVMKKSGLNI